jgi:tRNA threonylcarbamoyladenosine biosynthesis protein TsaE
MSAESSVELPDEAATLRLGASLAAGIAPGRVLHLSGELGSGKTTLVRGLLRELGHTGRVKSPTYTLVELYVVSRLNLYHFDFYRFKDRREWLESGFRDYFNAQSACIVEWPERAGGLLAPPDLAVRLEFSGAGRRAWLSAATPSGADWLALQRRRSSSAA